MRNEWHNMIIKYQTFQLQAVCAGAAVFEVLY